MKRKIIGVSICVLSEILIVFGIMCLYLSQTL